jgi:hypothetical protein
VGINSGTIKSINGLIGNNHRHNYLSELIWTGETVRLNKLRALNWLIDTYFKPASHKFFSFFKYLEQVYILLSNNVGILFWKFGSLAGGEDTDQKNLRVYYPFSGNLKIWAYISTQAYFNLYLFKPGRRNFKENQKRQGTFRRCSILIHNGNLKSINHCQRIGFHKLP